jgi:hypothetical protein
VISAGVTTLERAFALARAGASIDQIRAGSRPPGRGAIDARLAGASIKKDLRRVTTAMIVVRSD